MHIPLIRMNDTTIIMDPETMDGLPVFKGTRFPIYIILEMLEEGGSFTDIQREYPFLSSEQIKAAVHYAAERVSIPELSE